MEAVERQVAELAEQLFAWANERDDPLITVDVPPALLDPGDRFIARGRRRRDEIEVLFSCRVAHRPPWLRSVHLIKFEIHDPVTKESR